MLQRTSLYFYRSVMSFDMLLHNTQGCLRWSSGFAWFGVVRFHAAGLLEVLCQKAPDGHRSQSPEKFDAPGSQRYWLKRTCANLTCPLSTQSGLLTMNGYVN